MKKEILLKVTVDWPDEQDYNDQLVLEDSGILDNLKEGVDVEIVPDKPRVVVIGAGGMLGRSVDIANFLKGEMPVLLNHYDKSAIMTQHEQHEMMIKEFGYHDIPVPFDISNNLLNKISNMMGVEPENFGRDLIIERSENDSYSVKYHPLAHSGIGKTIEIKPLKKAEPLPARKFDEPQSKYIKRSKKG